MSLPEGRLLRAVYFSRNCIDLPLAEMRPAIDDILRTSQRNNARVGVTGALIFTGNAFGQVLEGPIEQVEEIFDRIQGDPRHCDVTVLDICEVTERSFTGWAMGYVGFDQAEDDPFRDFDPTVLRSQTPAAVELCDLLCGLAQRSELRNGTA